MTVDLTTLYLRVTAWWQGRRISRMARDPMAVQHALLANIIAANRDTTFGWQYRFTAISSYAEFAKQVPVSEFEHLRPFVEAEIHTGDAALTAEIPQCYMRTSGTTGVPKDLPLVPSHLAALRRIHRTAVAFQYKTLPQGFAGSILAMTSPANEGMLPNGKPYGSASGIVSRNTARSIRSKFVLPHPVLAISDSHLKYLTILRLALVRADISYIGTANPSTLIALMKVFRDYRNDLISDIRSGSFSLLADLPAEIAAAIRPRLHADPQRADALQVLGAQARIADLWPELRLIVAWTCAGAGVAAAALKQELSPQTKVLELGYVSSEFRGTITLGLSSGSGWPTLDTHFFEFVERDLWDAGTPEFLTLGEIRKGQQYYVIATTPSGLYRYFINDLVEVTGFLHRTPLLRFVQKGKGVTSITGEKLYESQVLTAVESSMRELGLHAHFLMMLAGEANAGYHLYVEPDQGTVLPLAAELAQRVDHKLATLNLEYQAKRESKRLVALQAAWLQPGTGDAYKHYRVAQGQREGQFKTVAIAYRKDFAFDFSPYLASPTP